MWPFSTKNYFLGYPPMPFFIDLRNYLPKKNIKKLKILNVGIGEGNSGLGVQIPYFPFKRLDNIDIHQPYLDKAKMRTWNAKKTNFINADIRNFDTTIYDIVLMFDILEHLPKPDALVVIKRIKQKQIIFIPLEKTFRENVFGAESQDHLSLWTEQDFSTRGYSTLVLPGFHHEKDDIFDALWAIKGK